MIVMMISTSNAFAALHTGTISLYHLNSEEEDRGACIQMSPAIPEGNGWACLWQDNEIYKEINALLLTGYATGNTCTIW